MRILKLSLLLLVLTATGCASFTPKQTVEATVVKTFKPQTTCGTQQPGLLKVIAMTAGGGYVGSKFGDGKGNTAMKVIGATTGYVAAHNTGDAGQQVCNTYYETLVAFRNPRSGARQRKLINATRQLRLKEVIYYQDRF